MEIQKTPLAQQLARLCDGNPAHPEFNAHAIRSMANIPITAYLHDYEPERAQLMDLLSIPPEQEDKLAYRQAAVYIDRLWQARETKHLAAAAIEILARPILNCYAERRTAYGSSTENPS